MTLSPTATLAQALVKIPSITPDDAGCQPLIASCLQAAGFSVETFHFGRTDNLLALHGSGAPLILLLGHTDVVPTGDRSAWRDDPFGGLILSFDGEPCLYGRGSADMKGGDAAMTLSLSNYVRRHPAHPGTLALLVTSNEEGDAQGGVPEMVPVLKARGLIPQYCLLAECSCEKRFGDEIKVGRRGDLNATVTVHGRQGHVAQPELCRNAAHDAARLICALLDDPPDAGDEHFPPSSFQISNAHCGTGADNVVPGVCTLRCNWRFNPLQTQASLAGWLQRHLDELRLDCELNWQLDGLPFFTPEGALTAALAESIREVTGITPQRGTRGGTSDGRFIAPLGAQTVEFGPVSATIHQVDEHVSLSSLDALTAIYEATLTRLLA